MPEAIFHQFASCTLKHEIKPLQTLSLLCKAQAMGMKPKVRAAPKAAPTGQELELLMRKARGEGQADEDGPPEPSADAMPGLGFSKCAHTQMRSCIVHARTHAHAHVSAHAHAHARVCIGTVSLTI